MDAKCENPQCPMVPDSTTPATFVCSDCSSARYCSQACQDASMPAHEAACKLTPPASLSGIELVVTRDRSNGSDHEFAALKTLIVNIKHKSAGNTVEVGTVKIQVVSLRDIPPNSFFNFLDAFSHDLANLAQLFNGNGKLRSNTGCWSAADFASQNYLVYIEEMIIEESWRERGLGSWLLPRLFYLKELRVRGAQFIITWPTVLNQLEPRVQATPATQRAWETKQERIIKFFQRAGFRRLANSFFFCLANDASHPSHAIPVDEDAPLK
ncbi:hypothetical protein C8J57DRAFT_1172645 [Mycena rebaudengoi]|nr:hypothetical protein C8J57DRAFT_1172645 [Mycena rebaudengoi]